jgi:hypothetical protein
MTKARAAPTDPIRQLSEANATIEVLRRSVHEEHAGAARAYLKLEEERARWGKLETLLRNAADLLDRSTPSWPKQHRALQERIRDALEPTDGARLDD